MQKIQVLEPPRRKEILRKIKSAKALKEHGYTVRDIGRLLGISKSRAHELTVEVGDIDPVELDMIGQQIKALTKMKEDQVASKILKKIEDKLDTAQFGGLVFAYKSIREVQNPRVQGNSNNTTNIQVKVIREAHSDKIEVTEPK